MCKSEGVCLYVDRESIRACREEGSEEINVLTTQRERERERERE